eukprot:9100631-Pyramimonas_sp.AAC.1
MTNKYTSRGRNGLWGVECTLAVVGTGGPVKMSRGHDQQGLVYRGEVRLAAVVEHATDVAVVRRVDGVLPAAVKTEEKIKIIRQNNKKKKRIRQAVSAYVSAGSARAATDNQGVTMPSSERRQWFSVQVVTYSGLSFGHRAEEIEIETDTATET